MIKLLLISLFVFLLNIPFGYWRANVPKFSIQWFLAIHVPVPFIVAMRYFSGLGFAWYSYVVLVLAFFLGQKAGGMLLKKWVGESKNVSSCLFKDIYRNR